MTLDGTGEPMKALERFNDTFTVLDPTNVTVRREAVVFNGRYSITFPDGEHRTFRIHTKTAAAKFAPGQRIVSLLIGPDNSRDYRPFAFIDDRGIHAWKKFRGQELERLGAILWKLATNPDGMDGYELLVAGTCLVCNKTLTTPTSLKRGMGDICWERIQSGK